MGRVTGTELNVKYRELGDSGGGGGGKGGEGRRKKGRVVHSRKIVNQIFNGKERERGMRGMLIWYCCTGVCAYMHVALSRETSILQV